MPQHTPYAETKQQQQHENGALMQQTDTYGDGVHHSLTHSIATQEKSG
jgi:hypothetical protein